MNANHLPNKFTAIGARLKMQLTEPRHWREDDYVVDIYHRRHGGFMPVRMPQRTRRRQPERHAGRRTSDGHISVRAALYPE